MIARGVKRTNADVFIERVSRVYGDEDWKRIQAARWRQDITAQVYRAEMVNLMRIKLEYGRGYRFSHRIPMQMHNKITIFDMVFASDHDAGDRIMRHLYNRAARNEPEMMRQAKSVKQQKESTERGEMGLFGSSSMVASKIRAPIAAYSAPMAAQPAAEVGLGGPK
jgi:hypothetical protein